MKYIDGGEVCIGDKVIAADSEGVVVCVIDTGQFSEEYPAGWDYLNKGMLIETVKWGLMHYPDVSDDVILVERAKAEDRP